MVVASRCFAFCMLITQAQINLKKFSSSKLDKFTLFTHSFVGCNLENRYKEFDPHGALMINRGNCILFVFHLYCCSMHKLSTIPLANVASLSLFFMLAI